MAEAPMSRTAKFPLSTLRRIVTADEDIALVKKDALVALDKAANEFIGVLVEEWARTCKHQRTLTYERLAFTVKSVESFSFLRDVVPDGAGGADAMQQIFKVHDARSQAIKCTADQPQDLDNGLTLGEVSEEGGDQAGRDDPQTD